MAGKFGLMGVMGLADNMSRTIRQAASAARGLRAEVQQVDRSIKALAGRPVNIRINVTGNAVSEVQRIEQRLSRVGRDIMFRTNAGQSRAAAALLDPNGAQQVARTGRVIQMEQARAAREQARIDKAQQKAQQILGRNQQRDQSRFQKEAERFLYRRSQAEGRAAQQFLNQQARAQRQQQIQVERQQRQETSFRNRIIDGFGRGMSMVGKGFWNTFSTLGRGAVSLVTAPFRMLNSVGGLLGIAGGAYGAKQLLGTALGFSSDMEQAQISYETMLKSAAKAKAFLGQQWTFAARTPFTFQETLENSRRLLAYGFKTEGASDWRSVMPWMTQIGNAVSSLGTGQEGFQRLSIAIGQVQAKGRLMGEEIRQLTETGIPVVEILAQKLGKTQEQIMKGADAGIMAEEALKALYQGLADRYGGGMAKQARTLAGLWTTVKDNFLMMLGGLGDGMRSVIQPALAKISDWFERNPMEAEIWRNRLMSIGLRATKGLADAFGGAVKRLDVLFGTTAFQNASLFGKAKLIWDDLIAKPFADWWATTGQEKVTKTAGEMGNFVGSVISGAVQAAFGFDVSGGSMTNAGLTAGQAFVQGFVQAFDEVDWGAVFGNAFKKHPVVTSAAAFGFTNFLTGGVAAWGTAELLKWGGKALLGRLFGTGAAAATEAGTTAAVQGGSRAVGLLGNPYVAITAALLAQLGLAANYNRGFEKRVGEGWRGEYGDAATNFVKWNTTFAKVGNPYLKFGLDDALAQYQLRILQFWGLAGNDANGSPMPGMGDVRPVDAPGTIPEMFPAKTEHTFRFEVTVKGDTPNSEATSKEIAQEVLGYFKLQLQNS